MNRIEQLEEKIRALYEAKHPDRTPWSDWLYEHHIFIVSENARKFAERFGANAELAMAAGMLHDVADTVMSRFDSNHHANSAIIARKLLSDSGFEDKEIAIIVDDAMENHNCRDDNFPQSIEAKVMATADAVTHIETDFYDRALESFKKEGRKSEYKEWARPKLERDFNIKIFFDDIREEVRGAYEARKAILDVA